MLHPLLKKMLQTVDHYEVSCLGAPFSWLEKPRNHMRQDLNWILCSAWKKWISGTPLEHPPYRSCPMGCLCFFNHEKGAPRQEILKWSTVWMVCSTFWRSGWNIVKGSLLAKGHTLKKTLSLHLHEVLTWSNKVNHELCKWPLYMEWGGIATEVEGMYYCTNL
jgi:hypothetical protein